MNWTAGMLLLIFLGFVVNIGQGSPLRVATCTIRHCPSFSLKMWVFKSLPAKRRANEISHIQLNDTLDDAMCPNAGSSDAQTDAWTAIYGGPVAERLNSQAPGANLVAADISNLIPLCAFESIVKGVTSPFCALFTPAEFAQFEYFSDLDKYYGTGSVQQLLSFISFHIHSNLDDRLQIWSGPGSCSRRRLYQ